MRWGILPVLIVTMSLGCGRQEKRPVTMNPMHWGRDVDAPDMTDVDDITTWPSAEEDLFQKAVTSTGDEYLACERELLAGDSLATLKAHLDDPDPVARLIAQ